MRYFLAGVCAPLLALFAFGILGATEFMTGFAVNWVVYACAVVGLPVGAAWLIAAAVQIARPRRLFAPHVASPIKLVALGVLAGLGTIGLVVIADAVGIHVRGTRWQASGPSPLMFLSRANDGVLFACAAAVSALGVLLPLARARDGRGGRCQACGYDLSGLRAPRCPECGGAIIPLPTRAASPPR